MTEVVSSLRTTISRPVSGSMRMGWWVYIFAYTLEMGQPMTKPAVSTQWTPMSSSARAGEVSGTRRGV